MKKLLLLLLLIPRLASAQLVVDPNVNTSAPGTVTSVGLVLPSIITVSGSPVTSSGSLTGTLATQVKNLVFVGPATGADAAPTFRLLVAADLPAASVPLTGTTGTVSGGLTLGTCDSGTAAVTGSTTAMSVVATPVTYPGDGVVWNGYVSVNGTVTVKECGLAIVTPTSTAYNVRVIP